MYTQFIKQAEEEAAQVAAQVAEQARDIKPEQFSEGGAAAIGALLGAAIGGIGGYNYSGMLDENLPEDKKFKKKLKNAITAGALGALGGAGLGYGGAAALNTLTEDKDDSSWIDSAVTELVDAPLSGTALGTGVGLANAAGKLGGEQAATRQAYNRSIEDYKDRLERARKAHAAKGLPFDPDSIKKPNLPRNIGGLDFYRKGKGVAKAVGIGLAADAVKSLIKATY